MLLASEAGYIPLSGNLRDEIVEYFAQHPYNADGDPLEYFAAIPWDDYLDTMAKNGEYGDHITMQDAA